MKQLRDFHGWMRGLQFLDPACGSGNFLYVTMAAVKRIELEVLNEIERVAGKEQKAAVLEEVHPRQFHGIEVKPWAREIAELTLWIGYHQFWRESHGGRTPPDPILEDTGTIECRDAVLAWDEIVHRPEKDRPDPTPRIDASGDRGAGARSRAQAAVLRVRRRSAGGMAEGGFHHRESAVLGGTTAARCFR